MAERRPAASPPPPRLAPCEPQAPSAHARRNNPFPLSPSPCAPAGQVTTHDGEVLIFGGHDDDNPDEMRWFRRYNHASRSLEMDRMSSPRWVGGTRAEVWVWGCVCVPVGRGGLRSTRAR